MESDIYLDNNSTTKVDVRVVESMMPFFSEGYGNAASTHKCGVEANGAVRKAREQVARLVGCVPNEIIFTSGATEAINLAIKGVVETNPGKSKHIVTVSTEHPAVLDTCRYLEKKGVGITYLPVKKDGLIDLSGIIESIKDTTILVSVMFVNNETGVIQPIQEVAEIAHKKGAIFMSDATQAVGKMPIKVDELGIDLMCFSGHKFYGPKGIGGLFVRGRRPNMVKLDALIHGGGHERGLRSGSLNVPGIVGIGKASEIAYKEMESDTGRIRAFRNNMENELLKIEDTFLNGNTVNRLYNTSNICFRQVDADALIIGLRNIAISNGSACSSESVNPSHVLKAMGLSDDEAYSCLRISLGKFNTKEEIDYFADSVKAIIGELRAMNR